MDRNIAKLWIKALRSGHYQRTTSVLQSHCGFCCLGVLCDVAEKSAAVKIKKHRGLIIGTGLTNQPAVVSWAGIKFDSNSIELLKDLIQMNDVENKTFGQIASYIEKHWEGL